MVITCWFNQQGTDKRVKKRGRLVRVLEERKTQIVGRFFFEHGYLVCGARRLTYSSGYFDPNEQRSGAHG